MKRKKILYVITKSVWGGAQRYIFDLATNLSKDRFEAAVITGGNGLLVEKLDQAGIRTIALPVLQKSGALLEVLFSFINFCALFRLIRIFQQERPDIVHLNSSKIGGLGALAACIASLVVGRRLLVIFTVHGWGFNENRPLPVRTLIFFISWFSSLFQNKIICINTADFKAAQRFIPRRKLALIFNGIGPINFLPREEARAFFAKKLGRQILTETILIGTNAELTKNKGLLYLIDALPRLNLDGDYRDLTSIVIGEGEDREKLQNQIRSLGLQNSVFLAGFIPEAARYLKAFDIFVLPSLKEGLPYTIMEAMFAGLPVIATNVGGIPDLVEHKKTGLLTAPKDVNALARMLQALIQSKKMREGLGNKAIKTIETKFKLRDMIDETISCYDRQ